MEDIIKKEALSQMLSPQDPADKRQSAHSKTIKTIDDLLKNIELRNKCKAILGFGYDDLKPDHFYEYEAEEKNEEIVRLLEDLGVLKADWTSFGKQLRSMYGMRKIIIAVDNNSVIDFFDRLSGKNTRIEKTTLRLVAHQLADGRDMDEFFESLESCGVPTSLFQYDENYPIDNEWLIAFDILKIYASSSRPEDLKIVFRIIEKSAHLIMFGGDEKKSFEFQNKISEYLQYDGYCFDNGKITKATEELIRNIKSRRKGMLGSVESSRGAKISLSSHKIIFDDNGAMIVTGELKCPLPPHKNEHFFCRAMFQFLPKEFIDWSTIYEKMENIEPIDEDKNKRSVLDTMYAVNNRVKEIFNTDDKLFTWKEKSITRNY